MGHKTKRPDTEKVRFHDNMARKRYLGSSTKIISSLGDFHEHVGKCVEGFEGVRDSNKIGKKNLKGRLQEFCDEKKLCKVNKWFQKQKKRK